MAPSLMPSSSSVVFLFLFLLVSIPPFSLSHPPSTETELLSVPTGVFSVAVRSALDRLHKTLSLLSRVSGMFHGLRLSRALQDCSDLLDAASDLLTWSLHLADPSSGALANGTGNPAADMKAWLSAALGNQDTCLDSFEGAAGVAKILVAGSVREVESLIADALSMVRQPASGSFPEWIRTGERRLLEAPLSGVTVDVTVAADGSGNFTSVTGAVAAAPDYNVRRYVIYVKRGIYRENVEIGKKKWNLMLIGDGIGATVISGDRNYVDGWTTFRSATFAVSAKGFIARDLTIENTAGPAKHQAVALRSDSDLSVFFRCCIDGYQDTLYAHSLRQFYRECRITGTVDFIFGNGAVVFQNCLILARKPLPGQKNSVTAHGRKYPNQNTGFSFQYCNVSADSDLLASPGSTATYLGRPWKKFSRAIFMQSYLSAAIRPEGWLEWKGEFALSTLFFAEYLNHGEGSALGSRVRWPGFHVFNESTQVYNYTVGQFIQGDMWLPETGVRYSSDVRV